MGKRGSGGSNRLSVAEHKMRNTFRPHRHGAEAPAPTVDISKRERKRILDGLSPAARLMATKLLSEYGGWDQSSLVTLRAYVLSVERLDTLQQAKEPTPDLYRELRANLALKRELQLETV